MYIVLLIASLAATVAVLSAALIPTLPAWANALLGGALIGLSATSLLHFHGRVAGVSGVIGGLLSRDATDVSWRVAFLSGLVGLASLGWLVSPDLFESSGTSSLATVAGAGLLVGYGTRLGNGCTSGHGVCGLARGSRRSLAAVLVFMSAAAATVFVSRHVLGGGA